MTFAKMSKQLISEVGKCELCGSKRNLEVHHIIPRVAQIPGINLDTEDNLIVVCGSCHARLTPRGMLSKYGIAKTPDRPILKFYYAIEDMDYNVSVSEMFDLVELIWADHLTADQKQERRERLGLQSSI